MTAWSQPSLIFIKVALLPSRIANASMIIDFPDPVSPEKILKPEANSKDKFSTKQSSRFLSFLTYGVIAVGIMTNTSGIYIPAKFFPQ